MSDQHPTNVMLNGKLHLSQDDNFTDCAEWWGQGSDGFAVEHPPEDSGIPDCIFCLARWQGREFSRSLFSTDARGLRLDQKRMIVSDSVEEAIERAERLYQNGELDGGDADQTGFYRWIGLFVAAAHSEAFPKTVVEP